MTEPKEEQRGSYHYVKKEVLSIPAMKTGDVEWIIRELKLGDNDFIIIDGFEGAGDIVCSSPHKYYHTESFNQWAVRKNMILATPQLMKACQAVIDGDIVAKEMCELALKKALGK